MRMEAALAALRDVLETVARGEAEETGSEIDRKHAETSTGSHALRTLTFDILVRKLLLSPRAS